MGEVAAGVGFEFNAFLEVHQVQRKFFWGVPQRGIGHQNVQQGGLARASAAGNERMLVGAATQAKFLQVLRP